MSSYARTLQKRILKKMGYTRAQWKVDKDGNPVRLKKGEGNIISPSAQDTGSTCYPR